MTLARRLRVAVLAGGRSSEHEISLASARSVAAALDPERYEIAEVAIGRDGRWALGTRGGGTAPAETLPVPYEGGPLETLGAVDVVLPILHGPFGEDGTVQGLLELAGVPYVGAGVAASALAMDKDLFKKVMRDSGIPVAAHHAIRLGDAVENPFGYPVFVKPARLGSSVGISKVHGEEELAPRSSSPSGTTRRCSSRSSSTGRRSRSACSATACRRRSRRCPARSTRSGTSGTTSRRSTTRAGWSSSSRRPGCRRRRSSCCSGAPSSRSSRASARASRASTSSCASDGEVVLNELNTMPGFTATSVWAKLFEASGIGYAEALDRLIELALERHERRSKLEY